jgi:L-lactate dehydrogenase complex protein LldF
VFLRLLARSATGQPVSSYTTHFHAPLPGGELHIVIVDNGRSSMLSQEHRRKALCCIRCGACLNTCPVYRRSGGYSYSYLIPGPIGSVLGPQRDVAGHASLPFASSLCGSCTDVCPVRVDLHHQLLVLRQEVAGQGLLPPTKRWGMRLAGWALARPGVYRAGGRMARWVLRVAPWLARIGPGAVWSRQRELPQAPTESFRDLWLKEKGK